MTKIKLSYILMLFYLMLIQVLIILGYQNLCNLYGPLGFVISIGLHIAVTYLTAILPLQLIAADAEIIVDEITDKFNS